MCGCGRTELSMGEGVEVTKTGLPRIHCSIGSTRKVFSVAQSESTFWLLFVWSSFSHGPNR